MRRASFIANYFIMRQFNRNIRFVRDNFNKFFRIRFLTRNLIILIGKIEIFVKCYSLRSLWVESNHISVDLDMIGAICCIHGLDSFVSEDCNI